jgi:hypothetical protein
VETEYAVRAQRLHDSGHIQEKFFNASISLKIRHIERETVTKVSHLNDIHTLKHALPFSMMKLLGSVSLKQ